MIYCVCCVSVHRVISHQIGRSWHRCRAARSACPFSTREDGLKPCDEAISVCWMTLCCACLGSSGHISEITEIFWNHQSLSSQKRSSTDLNISHQNILFRWPLKIFKTPTKTQWSVIRFAPSRTTGSKRSASRRPCLTCLDSLIGGPRVSPGVPRCPRCPRVSPGVPIQVPKQKTHWIQFG